MHLPSPPINWEEFANTLTHGIGLLLSCAGLGILTYLAAQSGTPWHLAGCLVFGSALVLVYMTSTLYHATTHPKLKNIFHVLDHVAIFLLIAGTYTPFTLVWMRDGWGWTLFGLIWGCALLGIGFKVFSFKRFRRASTVFYVLMGWVAVLFAKPMLAAIPEGAVIWLAMGGLFYTVGVIFYVWKSLRFGHAIWHLFVMAGSACHYLAVFFYILP